MSFLNAVIESAEQMKEGKEYIIPSRAIHVLKKLPMEVSVTPIHNYRRYIRPVVTIEGKAYVVGSVWDFNSDERNKRGWPIASIYSGVPEPMRIEHDYLANRITITNVLKQAIANKGLRFPAAPKKKGLYERGLTREEIEICEFPPTTLITMYYHFKSKEFRFNQFVKIRDVFWELVYTIRNVRYPPPVSPYSSSPIFLLKSDLRGAVVRLITGWSIGRGTARKRRSDIEVITQSPSGVECMAIGSGIQGA